MNKCNFFDFGARRIDKIISKDIENIIIDSVINGKKEVVINSICEEKNITIKWYFYSAAGFTYIVLSSLCTTSLYVS